jgi:hypothetical protein
MHTPIFRSLLATAPFHALKYRFHQALAGHAGDIY